MAAPNTIVSVEAKYDPKLLLKTNSVQDGKYLVYTTDSDVSGRQEQVVFKNLSPANINTTQFANKNEFDGMVEQVKNDPGTDPITINLTHLEDMPLTNPLSGITPLDNSAILDMAEASPDKKVGFQEIDKTINLQTESFQNVTGLLKANIDKFKIGNPNDGFVDTIKKDITAAKNAITGLFKTKAPIDIITQKEKNAIQQNATKITQTQNYMVKLEQWNQQIPEKLTTWNPDLGSNISVIFTVMPIVDENRSASYDSLTPTQHPGSIQVYKTTSSRTFNINGKFISRSIEEANTTLHYLNIIRSWVMPYYGSGTAESYPNKIGLPPEILKFNAYGEKNLKDIPVVLTNYSWTYPEDVDYVQAIDTNNISYPVPRVIEISLSIMECYAPNELSKFDLLAYKNGDLNKAYGGK